MYNINIAHEWPYVYVCVIVNNNLLYKRLSVVSKYDQIFCLQLENLLLSPGGVLKIADFGWIANIIGNNNNFNFCGASICH